jgi:hypothetical protein
MKLAHSLDASQHKLFNIQSDLTDGTSAVPRSEIEQLEQNFASAVANMQVTIDAAIKDLDLKESVAVAAVENIDLAAPPAAIQGVTLTPGLRVLLTAQTDATQNGIYAFDGTALARSADADDDTEVTSGMAVAVAGGDDQHIGLWILGTPDDITLGTTELNFIREKNFFDLTVGDGLNLSASHVLSLIGVPNSIDITENGIAVADTYAGGSAISTVGTIQTGTWNGSTVDLGFGGTGATNPAQARVNLGVAEEYSTLIGDGSTTVFTISHNFNNVRVSKPDTVDIATGDYVEASSRRVSANSVEITFGSAPAINGIEVVIIGVKKPVV